jgi:putative ABC transport system permease protein
MFWFVPPPLRPTAESISDRLLGRSFSKDEDQPQSSPVALLSYKLWQRRFSGQANVLGQLITTNAGAGTRYTIVGVLPRDFQFPEQTEIWFSAGAMGVRVPPPGSSQRCCAWLEVVARLKPGVKVQQAQFQISMISRRFAERNVKVAPGLIVNVVPLRDMLTGAVRRPLLILLSAVCCLLLIACVNVANLLLVRGANRRKEIALRVALGASRSRIIRQLVTESVLLAVAGGAIGTVLAVWGLKGIIAISGRSN